MYTLCLKVIMFGSCYCIFFHLWILLWFTECRTLLVFKQICRNVTHFISSQWPQHIGWCFMTVHFKSYQFTALILSHVFSCEKTAMSEKTWKKIGFLVQNVYIWHIPAHVVASWPEHFWITLTSFFSLFQRLLDLVSAWSGTDYFVTFAPFHLLESIIEFNDWLPTQTN